MEAGPLRDRLEGFPLMPDGVVGGRCTFNRRRLGMAQPFEGKTMTGTHRPAEARLNVLIVDDDQDICRPLVALLGILGYQAESAGDGQVAPDRIAEHHFDTVVLDMELPVMSGIDVARQLTARSAAGHRPRLIALTGSDTPEDRALCREAGMDAFLARPVRIARLNEVLRG
jgi:CheY-like chemotaxis protein